MDKHKSWLHRFLNTIWSDLLEESDYYPEHMGALECMWRAKELLDAEIRKMELRVDKNLYERKKSWYKDIIKEVKHAINEVHMSRQGRDPNERMSIIMPDDDEMRV